MKWRKGVVVPLHPGFLSRPQRWYVTYVNRILWNLNTLFTISLYHFCQVEAFTVRKTNPKDYNYSMFKDAMDEVLLSLKYAKLADAHLVMTFCFSHIPSTIFTFIFYDIRILQLCRCSFLLLSGGTSSLSVSTLFVVLSRYLTIPQHSMLTIGTSTVQPSAFW